LSSSGLLEDLAVVLCVAAVTTVVFRKLRQPVVLGYLLAGLIVGPHTPIPLFADMSRVHTLSELGVILVMFSVGLEFSIRKLVRVVPTCGVIGLVQISAMIWLGYFTAQAFGWTLRESVFTGAIVAISSTMIVAKVFAERRDPGGLKDTVFGVLVIQDLAAVLLLAFLTTFSSNENVGSTVLATTAGQLLVFLVAIVVIGFLIVPRLFRAIGKLKSSETLLVASVGLCFASALIAQRVGYSVALGAFLAGSLVAESGEAPRVERLLHPVRDMFAAVFFVAVGMILDPSVVVSHWKAVTALFIVVIVGQIASVTLGAFLSGRDVKTSIQAGMSLAQIGEFSFIIAAVGVASGAVGEFLYPVAVAVSILTTFTTPWLIRASERVAIFVDRHLPRPLQTFVSLYGSWVERLRASRPKDNPSLHLGGLLRLLAVDAFVIGGIVIGASLGMDSLLRSLNQRFGVPADLGRWLVVLAAILLSIPFLVGIARIAQRLGAKLAEIALPTSAGSTTDQPDAPRRALIVMVQLAVVVLVGFPLVALTQPFVSPLVGLATLTILFGLLAMRFWRSATNLQQHVQAGTQMIIETLGKQTGEPQRLTLEAVHPLLPAFGSITPVRIESGSTAVGKTLAQINLRALSGASVVTIMRGAVGLRPTGREEIREGDVLALAGTHEAIEAGTALLQGNASDQSA